VDTQLLVSCRQVNVWQLTDVVVGAAIAVTGVVRVGAVDVAGVLAFVVAAACGAVLVYCTWLVVTTGAFWLVRMDFVVELFDGLYQAGRWPVTIYPGWLRVGLTVLVPRTWWPAGVPGAEPRDGDRVHAGLGGIQHHAIAGEPVLNVYFRLAPGVQGRGIAGRILAECVRVAPNVASGVDIVVRTRPANTAARRVAERGGFVDEGLEPGTTDMQLLRMRAPDPM